MTPTAQNAFAGGAAFTVAGVPVGEDVAVVSAGLTFDFGARQETGISDVTFSISYDGQFGSGVVFSAATARLSFKF